MFTGSALPVIPTTEFWLVLATPSFRRHPKAAMMFAVF